MFGYRATFAILDSFFRNDLRFLEFASLAEAIPQHRRGRKGLKIKTGVKYPHSSNRQQARYSRQILAGQLNMVGCSNVRAPR